MAKLTLTCALSENPRTSPILDGTIAPEGITLECTPLFPSEMFLRQLKYAEFDVSEMSLSSITIATSQAPTEWVGLPVFTSRRFFHTGILIRIDRGINAPADLKGKKVGVPEFQQTAALWTRAVLRHEFGVHASDMEWWMERSPEKSHGGQTGFTPPPGVVLHYVPDEKNIGQMLVDGELDALIHFINEKNLVDRSTVNPLSSPDVKRLFDPPAAEAKRYYAKTNIYPINHGMVVRRSIVEKYPWVVLNLYEAFVRAKQHVSKQIHTDLETYLDGSMFDTPIEPILKLDPLAYGVKSARHVLETITQAVVDDGLAKRRVPLEELFSKNTLDF
jgi:4,5-dihydroxyphthalate decarboxylase